ncbi:TetR/AcrR family transcriptional regulator [Pseudonocardia sp. TRM90224]|uniref:TetR/AcrR family transcriptional regulator n=1 Tax=Pseudonocardia sp. TRM90224 TaxID=2812678 RepID=UPI001E4401F1|nr:TetR/AcrR family transcriptional regulator [Pseudonocardia sp. TRM90224]
MPRSSAQNEALRAATLEKVEAAAVALFAHRGYAATSMRDIAAEAGISTGLIYRHYATKDELFGALVGQAADGLRAVAEQLRAQPSPSTFVTAFARTFLADIAAGAGFAEFYMIMNQAFTTPDAAPQVRELVQHHEEFVDGFVALVARGQRLGECRPGDPADLVIVFLAALSGIAMLAFSLGARAVLPGPQALTGIVLQRESG